MSTPSSNKRTPDTSDRPVEGSNGASTSKRGRGRPRNGPSGTTSTVQALDRGLALLQLLADQGAGSLTDLSLQVGMPTATAYRLLGTLLKHGFVSFDEESQQWSIGVQAYRVGSRYLNRTNLVDVARISMRELRDETGETANLAVPDQGFVVFIGQVESAHPIRAFHPPGSRSPIHASGIGKAILAFSPRSEVERILGKTGLPVFTDNTLGSPPHLFADLDQTALRGWSYDDEERYAGMRCVAAPVVDAMGHVVAGVSVSGPTARFSAERVAELGPRIRRAAAQISAELGASDAIQVPHNHVVQDD